MRFLRRHVLLMIGFAGVCVGAVDQLAAQRIVKVLVASDSASWNYRFLGQVSGEGLALQLVKPREAVRPILRGMPEDGSVIVLADQALDRLRDEPELAGAVSTFVRRGGGLIFMCGSTFGKDHPLAELLPIVPAGEKLLSADAVALSRAHVTGPGLGHVALRMAEDPMQSQQLWREGLPAAFGPPAPVKAKKDAVVLAVDPARRVGMLRVPVIVIGRAGKGRVVFLNNSQTWRWRTRPIGDYHARFWRRLTNYASGQSEQPMNAERREGT